MDSKNHRTVEADFKVPSNQLYPSHCGAPVQPINSNPCQDHRSDTFWNASPRHLDANQPHSQPASLPWKGPHSVVIHRGPLGFGFTLRQFVVHPPQSIRDDNSDDAEGIESDQDYCLPERERPYQHQCSSLQRQLSLEPLESIFVRTVKEGSPAENSGLQPGDRLVAINGDSITGKPYQQVIETIHNCDTVLKLLVVPKDEDILQLAYAFQPDNSTLYNIDLIPDKRECNKLKEHCQFHSQSSLIFDEIKETRRKSDTVMDHHDVRYSFPLSGMESQEIDYRLGSSAESQPFRVTNASHQIKIDHSSDSSAGIPVSAQEPNFTTTYNLPSKSKYSFGLYFPPKSSAPSSIRNSNVGTTHTGGAESSKTSASNVRRKSSLDETSVLSASAKSRDYFIRYSTEKAARDNRNRYSPRHSAYERYPSESHPETYVCRSQTMSSFSPMKPSGHSVSQTTVQINSGPSRPAPLLSETKPSSSSDQVMVRIPCEQQHSTLTGNQPQAVTLPLVRQNYGTTFALTRSPTATHIEISKSIGKPIVSQRKYQFEIAATSDQPVAPALNPNSGGVNRYQSEIEKIRTQPKFSSIAVRKASFEQSPDRDPPGFDDHEDLDLRKSETQDVQAPKVETAQPTIKVRKISSERFHSGASLPTCDIQGRERPGSNIRIYVSPGNLPHKSSSPVVEIGIDSYKSQSLRTQPSAKHHVQLHSSDNTLLQVASSNAPLSPTLSKDSIYRGPSSAGSRGSLGGDSSTGLADSGVWVKSYHSSSSTDMLDGIGNGGGDSTSSSAYKPVAPTVLIGAGVDNKNLDQENQPRITAGWSPWKASYISTVHGPASTTTLVISQPGPIESHSSLMQTPQQQVAESQALSQSSSLLSSKRVSPLPSQLNHPYQSETAALVTAISMSGSPTLPKDSYLCTSLSLPSPPSPMPSSASSQSVSSMISEKNADCGSFDSVAEAHEEMVSSESSKIQSQNVEGHHHGGVQYFPATVESEANVTMRKKIQESLEDQANKLHRRTSYLMATARDRTNTVPIEKAFSSPQAAADISHLQSAGPTRHPSSVKLNKFFGEMIPSIAEGVEIVKSSEGDETPEIIRKGPLSCKISVIEGKKCSDRSWKPVFAILRQNELYLTREKDNPASSGFEDQHISLRSIMVEFARDYAKKKKHVFRMSTHNECEYLFQTEDRGTMLCWIQAIKSINDPEKAGKMEEIIAAEHDRQAQTAPIVVIPSHKMSPQIGGHKGRKLSALSLKAKLSSSPSMRRKKSGVIEKDESIKKTWMGRISMMKSLKKHSEDSNSVSLSEHDGDVDKMQFGVRIEDCFPSPHNQYVPLIVELCTRIVEARGLEVIGVYRVPGNSAAINALTEEFNRGIDAVNIDNEKLLDINVISSLLKSFFRKLEDPLVPAEFYENFIEANRHPDESKRKLKIKRLLHLLPPHHHETFRHMAEHLNKVASYGNINKMDAKNLAIMFGPTLVRKKEDDTVSLVTDMSDQCRIVESIILHHDWFFSTWDQDNHIPMETTVETVNLEDGQNAHKDEDEEADSAISTKELISSIVGAASKKLRSQRQAASIDLMEGITESVDGPAKLGTCSGAFSERNIDEAVYLASLPKGELSSSSRSASEEFLDKKSSVAGPRGAIVVPVTPMMAVSSNTKKSKSQASSSGSDPYFGELQYADATPPSPSLSSSTATGATNMSRYFSDESLLADIIDSNDELDDDMEILHPGGRLPTSLSRDAIHDTLKRIGNDVSALLHTFEQKQQKERERRKREQERVEAEHRRTRLELEQEDFDEGFDRWFLAPAWKGQTTSSKDRKTGNQESFHSTNIPTATSVPSNKMPDIVSSSYLGEHYPYEQERVSFPRGRENTNLDSWEGMHSSSKTSSNIFLPPQPLPTAVFTPPHSDPVSLTSRDVESKLKLSQTDAPDFLSTDLHIQEGPKEMMRSIAGYCEKQDFQSSPKQQLVKPVSSLRHSYGKRHGSLDSLIDMIDKDKRASWASSDSEDGSDLLTSITTTFDQKLQILLNPKYKLTGAGRKMHKNDNFTPESTIKQIEAPRQAEISKSTPSHPKQTSYTMAALLDSDRSFQDPSLHRSAKSDPKIGIACRFERNDNVRASSSSPKTCIPLDSALNTSQSLKRDLPDFRSFLGKSATTSSHQRDLASVVLTQPKKLDFENGGSGRSRIVRRNSSRNSKSDSSRSFSKSEKLERNSNLGNQTGKGALFPSDLDSLNRGDKENLETPEQVRNRKNQHRRHTVGGAEDFEHISALTHINVNSNAAEHESQSIDNRSMRAQQNIPSAWEQLRPAVKESGPGSMQAWIQRERLRGSTPDLSSKQD